MKEVEHSVDKLFVTDNSRDLLLPEVHEILSQQMIGRITHMIIIIA